MAYSNSQSKPSLGMDENDPLLLPLDAGQKIKSKKTASPWHAIIPLFFITLGMGALLAPMVQFYTEIFCNRYYESDKNTTDRVITWMMGAKAVPDSPSSQDCTIPEIQAIVSRLQTVVMFLDSAMSLFMASFYGSLSDRHGRRLICRIYAIGGIAVLICYIAVAKYQHIVGVTLILVAPFFRGLLVGDLIVSAAAQSYITDCTTPEERTVVMGRTIACMLLAVICGPTMAGIIALKTGTVVYVFYIVLLIFIVFYIYATYIMPESLSQEAMETAQQKAMQESKQSFWKKINIFSSLSILFKTNPTNISRYAIPILASINFILLSISQPPVLLYAMSQFKWSAYEGGLFQSSIGLVRFIIIVWFLPYIIRIVLAKLKQQTVKSNKDDDINDDEKDYNRVLFDISMIRSGFGLDTLGIILAATATTGTAFTLCLVVQSLSIIAQPSLISLITTLVDPSDVGALCSALALLGSVATLTTVTGINFVYSMSVKSMPNLFLYVCAGFTGLAFLLSLLVHPVKHQNKHSTP